MLTIYEVDNGCLTPRFFEDNQKMKLEDDSHLIVEEISEKLLCITNSFSDKCFIIPRSEWSSEREYPLSFSQYICYPQIPSRNTNLPNDIIQMSKDTVTFIIALSYDCNLRCKYCYQQCNPILSREKMTEDTLDYVLETISQYHSIHPDTCIQIELFGGEPLLIENYDAIIKIFDFCVDNIFSIAITTNGINLPFFLKDLVIYSGLNMTINTTIDSISQNEITRYSQDSEVDSHGESILQSIRTLIEYDVFVHVEANIDQHNINQLSDMISFYQDNGFFDSPNFSFAIARVDDRRFETGYKYMISETELLKQLISMNFGKKRLYYSFVKAPLSLCLKIDPHFRQKELKYVSNYCWASSPIERVFYIDSDLDVFRCTFSVGRKEKTLFKFSLDAIENYRLPDRTYAGRNKCRNCNIGGYCAGGCALSSDVDFDRMCEMEKKEFDAFLTEIFYPEIKKMVNRLE